MARAFCTLQATEKAAQQADCVLASHAEIAAAGSTFPFGAFGLLLQYVGPSLTEACSAGAIPAGAAAAAVSTAGVHLFNVTLA
jgi:hypothetical protein